MSEIRLAINRQNQRLVNYLSCITQFPDLFQSNTQSFRIYVVDPDPSNLLGGYVLVDMASSGLRVALGDTPTGSSGGPTPMALQDTWTWNASGKYFTGSIALNTGAVDSFLGSSASKTAYFEVNETSSGNRSTLLQIPITLKAVVDELSSTVPNPTDQYLTKAECLAMFAKLINDPGQTIILKSPNGTYSRELGCNDDGTAEDNV